MWPINYDSKDKLHMSVGMGIMVAAFVIYLFSINNFNSNLNKLDEIVSDHPELKTEKMPNGQMYVNQRMGGYQVNFDASLGLFKFLMIFGSLLFFLGYIPYLIKEFKKEERSHK